MASKTTKKPANATRPMLRVWVRYIMPTSMRNPTRSFNLVEEATFDDLHQAIQDACGWQNRHAWVFRDKKQRTDICGSFPDMPDAKKLNVLDAFDTYGAGGGKTMSLHYLYDWGDSWHHEVKLWRVNLDPEKVAGITLRQLVDGSWSFPLEDCGGFHGYSRILEFLETGEDPWGENVDELRAFIGTWQPHPFFLRTLKERANAFDR